MRINSLVAGAVLATVVLSAPTSAQVRKSITQLTATELASLRKGYAQMIAWNSAPASSADFKRSLRFWANMHAYFGQACGPTSGLNNQGMSGLSAQTRSTPEELATWCTCVHGGVQFLTWHRMYLIYFEQVLQQAAGDPNLRLPFWDYQTDGTIPLAFRSPTYVNGNGQSVANPLYVANRRAELNDGSASLTSTVTSTTAAMALTDYPSFNSSIEQTPHGAVHCASGVAGCNTGYMGAVPAAGNDPIFYTHHANIDRLYQCWLSVSPDLRLPASNLRGQQYSFINGQGQLVTRVVGDMLTTDQLGYSYATGGGCPRSFIPPKFRLQSKWKRIFPPGPWRSEVPVVFPSDVTQRARSAKVAQLVIEEPVIERSFGGLVQVALQATDGRVVPLGVISGFNDTAPDHGHDTAAMATMQRELRFDARDALIKAGPGAKVILLPVQPIQSVNKARPLVRMSVTQRQVSVQAKSIRLETN